MPHNQSLHLDDESADDWNLAEVEVGILIFDIEHREMLDDLHKVYDGLAASKPARQVRASVSRLLATTAKHFAHEEDYMKTLNYADYRRHADDHEALNEKLKAFVDEFFADAVPPDRHLVKVRAFFRKWLLDHILEHDHSLANFLAQKGIR